MDERVKHIVGLESGIITASRIVVREGMMPVRFVLRKLPGKFVTHEETLTTLAPEDGTSCAFLHHGFAHGHYFDFETEATKGLSLPTEEEAIAKAIADFKDRAAKL